MTNDRDERIFSSLGLLIRAILGGLRADWKAYPGKPLVLAVAAGLFAVVAAIFLGRMEYVIAHPQIYQCLLGSDTRYALRHLVLAHSPHLRDFLRSFRLDKHPGTVIVELLFLPPLMLAGFGMLQAVMTMLALLIGSGAVLLFAFLHRSGCSVALALSSALLSLVMFSPLTVLSAVDVYGLVYVSGCLSLFMCAEVARYAARFPRAAGGVAGLLAGAAAWTNIPLASYVLTYSGRVWSETGGSLFRRTFMAVVVPALVALSIAAVPLLVWDLVVGHHLAQVRELNRWASITHFADLRILENFAASFFAISIVNPFDTARNYYGLSDLAGILESWRRGAALLLVWGLMAAAVWTMWRREIRLLVSLLAACASLFVFYIFFDPFEATLFAIQWTLLFAVIVALGLRARVWAPIVIFCTVGLLAWSNFAAISVADSASDRMLCKLTDLTALEAQPPP